MTGPRALHDRLVVIDGLQVSNWDRELLLEVHRGGITCINATLVIWEDARATLDAVGAWHRRFREHADLIRPVRSCADIDAAKREGRVGVLFGAQNASLFEDDLALVEVFWELGFRVVQLTYNNQSLVGSGCYEAEDGGLTRFGRNVVREMDRLGMIVDLSHVGERTSLDAMAASTRPVAITHANPASFVAHRRNKSDRVLHALKDNGGILGCTPYPPLSGGERVTLEAWCEMVARACELLGTDHVAMGTDSSRKWSAEQWMWIRMGRWTHEPDHGTGSKDRPGEPLWPSWFRTPADMPNLTAGLLAAGFGEDDVARIMGGNWLRLFRACFG